MILCCYWFLPKTTNRTFLSFWTMITINPAIERLLYRLHTLSTAIWRLGVLPSFKVTPIGVRVCRVSYFWYLRVFTSNNISSDPDGPTALLMASDHHTMPYPIREPFHHRFIGYIWPSNGQKASFCCYCEHRFTRCYYLRLSQAVRIEQRCERQWVHRMRYTLFGNVGGYYIVEAKVPWMGVIVKPFFFIFAL